MAGDSSSSGGVTGQLIFLVFTCCAGSSLQFGYNLVVINAPQNVIKEFFSDKVSNWTLHWSFAVSIFMIGGMIGAFFGPHIAKKFGRKKTLILNGGVVIIGGLLLFISKYAKSMPVFIIGRFIVGLNAGVNSCVSPMYVTEIAPVRLRGSIGTLHQFGIVTGILLANVLGLSELLGNAKGWPFLFGFTVVVAALQFLALPFCPESPRYLLAIKKDEEGSKTALKMLRGTDDVSEEIEEMKLEAARASTQMNVTLKELFQDQQYRKPLFISLVMQASNQLTGIGGILFYSTNLFKNAGMSQSASQAATCGVGALSVIVTIIVIFLVEVKGRKFLMLLGLGGLGVFYAVTTIALTHNTSTPPSSSANISSVVMTLEEGSTKIHDWATYLSVTAVLACIFMFQLGPGAIPWFIVAEVFSQTAISAAMSIVAPTNWLCNFAVGLIFPYIAAGIEPYTFLPFLAVLALCFLYILIWVPETKGLTIEEITSILNPGSSFDHKLIADEQAQTKKKLMDI